MGKPLAEILRQLERKRKYCCSYGTGRTTTTSTLATAGTLLVSCIFLLYVSLWATSNVSSDLTFNFSDELPSANTRVRKNILRNGISFQNRIYNVGGNGKGNGNTNGNGNGIEASLNPSQANRLEHIFHKADTNGNKLLDSTELSKWINDGVRAHMSSALKNNFDKYFQIDTNPRNGLVTWNEYLEHYMREIGLSEAKLTPEDIKEKRPVFTKLPKDVKVEIARMEAGWSEAASNNPEFLTVDEFLAFQHPEASPTKLLSLVQETFGTFDLDADGVISTNEFETTYREAEGVDPIYKKDLQLIDTDQDGQITRVEMMKYTDPRNVHHSDKAAKNVIHLGDTNGDGRLSLTEVLTHRAEIVKTMFYDVTKNLHNLD